METKVCTKCNTPQPIDHFLKGKGHCRTCRAKYSKWYRAAVKNGTHPREQYGDKKLCSKCKKLKPLDQFSPRSPSRPYLAAQCKQCKNEHTRSTAQVRKINRWERELNLEKGWLHAYIESHHGQCEICGKQPKTLHIDHCHATNTFRGLLCSDCNLTLGKFNDDPTLFEKAIEYLVRKGGDS